MSGKTRLFTITWDNSRMPNLRIDDRIEKQYAEGVQFSTGFVALSNGAGYNSMDEMDHILHRFGKYTVTYQDEQESQDRGVA